MTQRTADGAAQTAGGASAANRPLPAVGVVAAAPPSTQPAPTPVAAAAAAGSVCNAVHIDARPQAPDVLIVLDRSGSMGEKGRWDPSVSALRRVTEQLQTRIHFGLALFPEAELGGSSIDISDCAGKPDLDGCVDRKLAEAACVAGAIVVPVAQQNATPISQALDATLPMGGTPTPGTLQGLLTTFAPPPSSGPNMAAVSPRYLLLVTDGQPTCPAGKGNETTQADIDATNAAVEALALRNVKTYVIGYDTTGPGNEMVTKVLDGIAMRGGTGDMMHRTVEDETSLVTELERITGALVECSYVLESPPERADHVLVRRDGTQINLGAADGWTLEGDRTVRFVGAGCSALRDGTPHTIDVEVQCAAVVPQ